MTRKNIISLVSFILVAVLMVGMLSHLMRDKESSFDNYYLLPEDTVDVFFVGSSHVYSGYCPALLWEEYGVSAYNVYAWSMPMWTGYYYVSEALKTQSPDVVFFDTSSLIQNGGVVGEADEKTVDNREQNLWFASGKERFLLSLESYTPDSELFDLELFHNKWKHPEKIEWSHEADTDLASLRNFGPLFGYPDFEVFNFSWDTTTVVPPSPTGYKYLEKLVELSEKENFKLVFVLTPYQSNEYQNAVNNWLHQYAAEKGIDYIDFMMGPGIECGFDYRYDMSDADHVNHEGAFKMTRYCGDYLRSLGICDRRDNPDAAQLDKDAAATFRIFEYTELFGETLTAESYSDWLSQSGDYTAALISPEALSARQQLFTEKLGIDSPEGCTAIVKDGALQSIAPTAEGELDLSFMGGRAVINGDTIDTYLTSGALLLNSSRSDLLVLLYDEPMGRLVYAVSVADDGSLTVQENTKTIRGAAEN